MSAAVTQPAASGTLSPSPAPSLSPSKGSVGMVCLILAETAFFAVLLVAYVYYIGKSLAGPRPADVLDPPLVRLGADAGGESSESVLPLRLGPKLVGTFHRDMRAEGRDDPNLVAHTLLVPELPRDIGRVLRLLLRLRLLGPGEGVINLVLGVAVVSDPAADLIP